MFIIIVMQVYCIPIFLIPHMVIKHHWTYQNRPIHIINPIINHLSNTFGGHFTSSQQWGYVGPSFINPNWGTITNMIIMIPIDNWARIFPTLERSGHGRGETRTCQRRRTCAFFCWGIYVIKFATLVGELSIFFFE